MSSEQLGHYVEPITAREAPGWTMSIRIRDGLERDGSLAATPCSSDLSGIFRVHLVESWNINAFPTSFGAGNPTLQNAAFAATQAICLAAVRQHQQHVQLTPELSCG
jgi:hypothetical protein